MKNLLLTFACSMLFVGAQAQAHLGVNLVNGSAFEQWGGQIQIGYQFKHLGVRASYGQFFNDQISMKPSMVNFDLSYRVPTKAILIPYVFTGINLTKAESRPAEDLINYGTYGGLNLGMGGYFNFNFLQPFTEAKYVTGEFNQWYVSAGVRYLISN